MQTFPASVNARQKASGGPAPVALLEIQSLSGNQYFWSDASISVVPVLNTEYASPQQMTVSASVTTLAPYVPTPISVPDTLAPLTKAFLPWLCAPPVVSTSGSTQTDTATVTVQNVSGNTVQRDVSLIFSRQEMVGAMVFFRIWRDDCKFALYSFQGYIDDVDIEADGETMTLQIESWCRWGKIQCPGDQIGASCQLMFALVQCGSTSVTPCNNDLGTCTSPERFKGFVNEYVGGTSLNLDQYAQAAPQTSYNPRTQN